MRLLPSFIIAAALAAAHPACATQFWFGGKDPVAQAGKKREGPSDWMAMFAPGAPWQQGERRLTAFKVSAQFVLGGTDEMIRTVAGALHQHHIALAVEMGAVLRTSECGGGEGYAPPDLVDRVAGRLQKLGLTMDYWTMDEPLWFGHEKSWGRNDCTYSVDEVARRVGQNVATMRRYFPNVVIGDTEVVAGGRIPAPRLVADYAAFAQAFRQQTGRPLAFFHADVAWSHDGQEILPALWQQMRGLGIRTGVIIGGGITDGDDNAWVAAGMQRLQTLLGDPAMQPDDIIVQSWQPQPARMLPETAPYAFTYLLRAAEDAAR